MLYFLLSQSSNKNWFSIPDYLHHFTRRQVTNINFHISVSIISFPSGKNSNDGKGSQSHHRHQATSSQSIDHVYLSSSDISVSHLLIMDSIFVKPIIYLHLHVNVVSKIRRSCGSDKEFGLSHDLMSANHFLIDSSLVLLKDSKFSGSSFPEEHLLIYLVLIMQFLNMKNKADSLVE